MNVKRISPFIINPELKSSREPGQKRTGKALFLASNLHGYWLEFCSSLDLVASFCFCFISLFAFFPGEIYSVGGCFWKIFLSQENLSMFPPFCYALLS